MNNEIDKKERWEKVLDFMYRINIFVFIVFIVLILCLPLLMSCHTNERVVESQHTEHHWHTDSVIQRDSVIMEKQTTIMQLDSAQMAKYGIQLKNAERAWLVKTAELERQIAMLEAITATADTIRDTITIRQTITKTDVIRKDKELTWWQKIRLSLGNVFLWVLVIIAVVFGVKYIIMKVVRP